MMFSRTVGAAICVGASLFAVPASAVPRQTLPNHVPQAFGQSRRLGPLASTARLNLAVGLPLRNRQDLDLFLQQVCDPRSPSYRRYLSASEFAERFGPTQGDYDKLMEFLQANGLAISGTHPNRMILDVTGPVSAIDQTLHINMTVWEHPARGRFFAPDRDPWLDIDVAVLDIAGLDNFVLPRPMDVKAAPLASARPMVAGSGPGGLFIGGDFRAAYAPGVSLTGAGQTVGLFELDGFYAADVQANFQHAGLPPVPVETVLLDGVNGSPVGSGNMEVILDIMMAAYMAPGANIMVYEGSNPDDVLNRMATDNIAKQLSSSWCWSPIDATMEQIFQQMIAQGQSLMQASGDGGAYSGPVMPFADDPNLTVVGGTVLTTTGPGGPWLSESAWSESGGGVSTTYAIPSYQQGMNMAALGGSNTMRNIPDVALTAAVQMFLICNDGEWLSVGGTSAAAPLWSGFIALANQQAAANSQPAVGFLNPTFYAIGNGSDYATDLHDIVTGGNGFAAIPGFDLATGWGTPAGQPLINDLSSMPGAPSFGLSAAPTAVSMQAGSGTSATIQITPHDGFSGSVNLSVSGLPSGVTGMFGAIGSNGASQLNLTASSGAAPGSYAISVQGVSGTLTASVGLILQVVVTYTISGEVALSGSGLSGVTVTLGGAQSNSATTNSSGNYSFTVPAAGNYTVTPSLSGYTFNPASLSFNNLRGNQTANFTASPVVSTYTVSGQVTFSGSGLGGVTVMLSGSQSGSAATNGSGNYSFTVPSGGNYTVIPSLAGYTFNPASLSFNKLSGSQTSANVVASIVTYTISGQVTFSGSGLGGVTVMLSGSQSGSAATTNGSGNYSFTVPAGGNYTVTPSLSGYTFNPASLSFNNLSGNQTSASFVASVVTYTISGQVTLSGSGLSGVTVTLSGSQSNSATTNGSGNYSFTVPAGGNYTVTPSLSGYTFNPASLSFNKLSGNQTSANFVAGTVSYTISGQVTLSGSGLGGVTVTLGGSQSNSATTNGSGSYSFSVPAAGTYTLTPSATGYSFSPPSQTFTNLSANQTAISTATCALSVNPTAVFLDSTSQSGPPLSVATGPACSWVASANAAFIGITSGASGSGNDTVRFSVPANTTGADLMGTLSVNGQPVSITQREAADTLNDVPPSNGFFDFINTMYERGITAGCATSPLQYCPDSTTTRVEMAVFIITGIEGGNTFSYTTTPYFTDVPATDPFFRFVQKMKDLGITGGCSATMYCPDDPVTRGEMAGFIILGRYGAIDFSALPGYSAAQIFSDVPPSSPFYAFIQEMAETGITGGCGSGMYCPDAALTRGQMAVFMVTGLLNQLLPAATPLIVTAVPNAAAPGQAVTLTLSGVNTNFVQGATQVTMAPGITPTGIVVSSATSLTVQVAVGSGVVPGPTSIVVTTGTEEAMLPNGFTVQ